MNTRWLNVCVLFTMIVGMLPATVKASVAPDISSDLLSLPVILGEVKGYPETLQEDVHTDESIATPLVSAPVSFRNEQEITSSKLSQNQGGIEGLIFLPIVISADDSIISNAEIAGEIITVTVPVSPVVAGEQVLFSVDVRNTGNAAWAPEQLDVEVVLLDHEDKVLVTGWGTDAIPYVPVTPDAQASVVAYMQIPSTLQGNYRYKVNLWYESTLIHSHVGETVLDITIMRDTASPLEKLPVAPLATQGGGGQQAVDIVFLMDTSGSMYDEFSALCTKIDEIVQGLQNRGILVRYNILGIAASYQCATDYVTNFYTFALFDQDQFVNVKLCI